MLEFRTMLSKMIADYQITRGKKPEFIVLHDAIYIHVTGEMRKEFRAIEPIIDPGSEEYPRFSGVKLIKVSDLLLDWRLLAVGFEEE